MLDLDWKKDTTTKIELQEIKHKSIEIAEKPVPQSTELVIAEVSETCSNEHNLQVR